LLGSLALNERFGRSLHFIRVGTKEDLLDVALVEFTDAGENYRLSGSVMHAEAKALTLLTKQEMPVFADVRIQVRDLMYLGTVLQCLEGRRSPWEVTVQVRRRLMMM
jgi:hypothetical protein